MKVLVIENKHRLRQTLLEVLEYEGIETIDAENDRTGIVLAQMYHPDLILYALEHFETNGGGFLSTLFDEPSIATIPIIYLLSELTLEEVQDLANVNIEDCLTMPFQIEELLTTIHDRVNKPAKSLSERFSLCAGEPDNDWTTMQSIASQ